MRTDRKAFPWIILSTTALGSFLLFQVQPLIARFILPWFGGVASVWTLCLVFFQSLLLAGYAYAHLSVRRLSPRAGAAVHVAILATSLLLLPIIPSSSWREPTAVPTAAVLGLLLV